MRQQVGTAVGVACRSEQRVRVSQAGVLWCGQASWTILSLAGQLQRTTATLVPSSTPTDRGSSLPQIPSPCCPPARCSQRRGIRI